MRWLLVASIIVVLDQLTKFLILTNLELYESVAIFPGLNFYLTYNTGVAFGILANQGAWGRWFLITIAIVVSLILLVWLYKYSNKKLERYALAIIFGGAIGNFIDRLMIGKVVDFIDVYYSNWHWYTFNIADSAICIGVALLLLSQSKKTT